MTDGQVRLWIRARLRSDGEMTRTRLLRARRRQRAVVTGEVARGWRVCLVLAAFHLRRSGAGCLAGAGIAHVVPGSSEAIMKSAMNCAKRRWDQPRFKTSSS